MDIATPQGSTVRFYRITLLLALSTGACGGEELPGQPLSISPDSITVVEEIRAVPFSVDDEFGIRHIADLIATPVGYAIADAGGYVLLLSDDLALRRRFGGEGGGPRELRYPQDLEAYGDSVAIFDSGNARITIVDGEGQLAQTLSAKTNLPTDFAVLGGREVIVGRHEGTTRLTFFHPRGLGSFGTITEPYWQDVPDVPALSNTATLLVAGSDQRVHHYDKIDQLLYTYSPDGSLESVRRFPDAILERIAAGRRKAEKAFGADKVVGFTLVLGLSSWGPHPVIVAPSLPGMEAIALVLDPVEPVATPILPGPNLPAESRRNGDVLALKGDVLTLANTTGIYQYRVRYPPRLRGIR